MELHLSTGWIAQEPGESLVGAARHVTTSVELPESSGNDWLSGFQRLGRLLRRALCLLSLGSCGSLHRSRVRPNGAVFPVP
jgi:hypothetical protein